MNAIIVEKKTSPPVDGVLNIDTIHLSVGISIPYNIYKYWKKRKGDSRIRKVKSELGNLDLIYYNSSFNSTLVIELSVTKFLMDQMPISSIGPDYRKLLQGYNAL